MYQENIGVMTACYLFEFIWIFDLGIHQYVYHYIFVDRLKILIVKLKDTILRSTINDYFKNEPDGRLTTWL